MRCPKCSGDAAEDARECSACGGSLLVEVMGPDGQPYGPYPAQAIDRYVAEGRVSLTTSQARIGEGDWAPLHQVLSSVGVQVAPPPPPPMPSAARPPQQKGSGDEWLAKQVPYRNAPALTAYYVGVFSIIPCIGILLALVAIPFGIAGLKRAQEHPEAHGKAHAWTGIVLGGFSLAMHVLGFVWLSGQ